MSAEARDLLIRNDAIAKEFKGNTTTHNSALSFTSMNTDLDRGYASEEHGACAFRVYGNVRHLISPKLITNLNNMIQQPRFAQIYIFKPVSELQNRMNVAISPDVRSGTIRLLQVNPIAGPCNNTRFIVNSLGTDIIEATISNGPKKGDIALIPRIKTKT